MHLPSFSVPVDINNNMTRVNTLKDIEKIYLESRFHDTDVEDETDTSIGPGHPDYETGDERWDRLHRDHPEVVAGYRRGLGSGYEDIRKTAQARYDKEKQNVDYEQLKQKAKDRHDKNKRSRRGLNSDDQREQDEREMELIRAMQKFGHGADYNTPFEETDHSKDAPALAPGDKRQPDGSVTDKHGKVVYKPRHPKGGVPYSDGKGDHDPKHKDKMPHEVKEGNKGTKTDREKADVNDNGKIEGWEKAKANAIRKSQGKTHLCAKTVNHENYGPGATIHAQHAIPDVNGDIEWYMVEFKHGIEKVYTEDIEVVFAVEHNH